MAGRSRDLELSVHGGIGGIAAQLEDMQATAKLIDDISLELLDVAVSCHRLLASPDVVASAALDPVGAARFEVELLAALDGPQGLTAMAGAIGMRAVTLRAAAVAYRAADEMAADLAQARRFFQGAGAAAALPGLLTASAGFLVGENAIGRDPADDLQHVLTEHPGIVDEVVGAAPGFVSALSSVFGHPVDSVLRFATGKTLFPTTIAQSAGLLGLLYPDGRPVVRYMGLDERSTSMTLPPRGFNDLLSSLDYRNSQGQGQIDVRAIERTMPDGLVQRSYIVDIPGTKDWQLNPVGERIFLNDLGTNLHVLAGDITTYARGVAEALRRAGARPGDAVMLVGHSQGGMVAMRSASDFVTSGMFNVTHVVTAGSPVAGMSVPRSVQVLSLENEYDIIPHLDGRGNPDTPNRITVTFAHQLGTVGHNHSITSIKSPYRIVAKKLDESADLSVLGFRDSAKVFFQGERVSGHAYEITRDI